MTTTRADDLVRAGLQEGTVKRFIRAKVVRHIEAPMTQMLLGERPVKPMVRDLSKHGFEHQSSMAFNDKIALHRFKRGHRMITITRFKEPDGSLRVKWTSAGLTGHGIDGQGEHHATLTTHLKAITPRLRNESFDPARPPKLADWASPVHRAWISPEGEVHPTGDHTHWAKLKADILKPGEADEWGVIEKRLKDGWIRKTTPTNYEIGYGANNLHKVAEHLAKHHPDVRAARVDTGADVRYVTPSGEVYEATDPKLLKTEPSYKWPPPDFADRENRAWISPSGETHKLDSTLIQDEPDSEYSQTHTMWAHKNPHLSGASDDVYDTVKDMKSRGWIRKTAKDYYSVYRNDPATLALVHQHFTTHHPKLRKVTVDYGQGTLTLHKQLRVAEATDHKLLRVEPSLDDTPGDWEDSHNRAWIAPSGEVHKLGKGKLGKGGQTHLQWALDNQDKTGPLPENPSRTVSHLRADGWVRKVTKSHYDIENDSALGVIHQHFTTHHPELRRVTVRNREGTRKLHKQLRDPAAEKKADDELARALGESGARDEFGDKADFLHAEHRAWISPSGEVHRLGNSGQQTHPDWARESGMSARTMLKDGWIRKVNPRRYEVHGTNNLEAVREHLRRHHPEVKRAKVNVGPYFYTDNRIITPTGPGPTAGGTHA